MDVTALDTSPDLVHLEVSGRMDTAGVEKSESRFYALFAPRGVDSIFDLSKVTILTSMGLRILIAAAKTAQSKGFRVVLVAPAGPVRDVLDHAAIEELIPVVPDGAAARLLLRGAERAGP
jgi:anti-sigma B factor antagonist